MFCFHKKLGPVKKDGYQYCKKCGKAFPAPAKLCTHKFVLFEQVSVIGYYDRARSVMYPDHHINVYHCTKCGDQKVVRVV